MAISPWGAVKLFFLCVVTGYVMALVRLPEAGGEAMTEAVGSAMAGAVQSAGWVLQTFWRPALEGALIVIPAWLVWRLATLPLRR